MHTMLNPEVTAFLDELNHPLRPAIDRLREIILSRAVEEGIKWNSPNYSLNDEDRITLRVHPPKQAQLVFHRGAKVKEQPKERLLQGPYPILAWKGNDRAIATFRSLEEVQQNSDVLKDIIAKWLEAAAE